MKKIKAEHINLSLTILGFLFSLAFYWRMLHAKDTPAAPVFDSQVEQKMEKIDRDHTEREAQFKMVQDSLTKELLRKDMLLKAEQVKLQQVRAKIERNISVTWEELSEPEQIAYTEYAINQIKNISL